MDDQRDYEEEAANRRQSAIEAMDELEAERLAYLNSLPDHLREHDVIDLDDPVITLSQAIQMIGEACGFDPVEAFHAWMNHDEDKIRKLMSITRASGVYEFAGWV